MNKWWRILPPHGPQSYTKRVVLKGLSFVVVDIHGTFYVNLADNKHKHEKQT